MAEDPRTPPPAAAGGDPSMEDILASIRRILNEDEPGTAPGPAPMPDPSEPLALTEAMLVVLGKAGIKTLDDLADLATDELIAKKRSADPRRRNNNTERRERPDQREEAKGGVLGEFALTEEQGNEIIMAARAHWFTDEEEAASAESSQ